MLKILFIISLIAIAVSFIATIVKKTFKLNVPGKTPFEGDIDPDLLGSISEAAYFGDHHEDYYDEDDMLTGDPEDDEYDDLDDDDLQDEELLHELFSGDASFDVEDPELFLSGDIDLEEQQSFIGDADFMEGGYFNRRYKRSRGRARRRLTPSDRKRASRRVKSTYSRYARKASVKKTQTPVGFKPDLLKQKMIRKAISSKKSVGAIEATVKSVVAMAKSPGALTAQFMFSRIAVTGGRIRISETSLKVPGRNLTKAVELWELYTPGRSRSKTGEAVANTPLLFSFTEPTDEDITEALPIHIYIQASELAKIHHAEVQLTITGKNNAGTVMSFTKDRIELFTHPTQKHTVIVFIPTIQRKQVLYATPFASPTTGDPINVTLTGLPAGTNVTVRLAGNDTKDWVDYKRMTGIETR